MRKQWISVVVILMIASIATANVVHLPAAMIFKYAEPMGANGACSDGLSFTLPTIAPDTTKRIIPLVNFTVGFTASGHDGHYICTGDSAGQVTFGGGDGICIDENRSGQSYCIHQAGLSAISAAATDGASAWTSVQCAALLDVKLSPNEGVAIGASCAAKGSCSYNAGLKGSVVLTAADSSCTPV